MIYCFPICISCILFCRIRRKDNLQARFLLVPAPRSHSRLQDVRHLVAAAYISTPSTLVSGIEEEGHKHIVECFILLMHWMLDNNVNPFRYFQVVYAPHVI